MTLRMPKAMVYESTASSLQGSAIASACSQLSPASLPESQQRWKPCSYLQHLAVRWPLLLRTKWVVQGEAMRTEAPRHRSTSAFSQHVSVDVCHNHTPLQAVE